MMRRIVRAALFALVPAEVLLTVLLVAGVPLPGPLVAVTEVAVLAALVVVAGAGYRLFRVERLGGANRRTALRATYDQLVPVPVRRIMGFELKGMVSLVLWMARRRHGVPRSATAVPYSGAQTAMLVAFLVAMVIELVAVEVLLRAIGTPTGVRAVVLVADGYTVLIALAAIAAGVTRPHAISAEEVRIRYGAFFDLRVPRGHIAAVGRIRNFNERGMVKVDEDRLAVAVSSQTNLVLELTEPITAVRPLGRPCEIRTVRFFADDPRAAINALQPQQIHMPRRCRQGSASSISPMWTSRRS